MTDTGNSDSRKLTELRSKRGFIRYEKNPSIPDPQAISRRRPVRLGDDKKGFVIDGVGEIIGMGAAGFYEFEEVDTSRFVKLFLGGIKQAVGLSKAGLAMFELVYRQVQDNPGTDQIGLSYELARRLGLDLSERVFRNGLRDLLEREFLFESLIPGVFFVNIRYMFNGDRIAFVKAYKRKGARANQEDFFDAAPVAALPKPDGTAKPGRAE